MSVNYFHFDNKKGKSRTRIENSPLAWPLGRKKKKNINSPSSKVYEKRGHTFNPRRPPSNGWREGRKASSKSFGIGVEAFDVDGGQGTLVELLVLRTCGDEAYVESEKSDDE